jgi:hypothetical protein
MMDVNGLTGQLVNFSQERIMSQRDHEQSNPKNAPMSEQQKQQEPPVGGASPDDPFPVEQPGTGKPGQRQK